MAKKLTNLTNTTQLQLYLSISLFLLHLRMVSELLALTFRVSIKSILNLSAQKSQKLKESKVIWAPTSNPILLSSANWRILGIVNLLSSRLFWKWYGCVAFLSGDEKIFPKSKPKLIDKSEKSPVWPFPFCRVDPVWSGDLIWRATFWMLVVLSSQLMGALFLVFALILRCYPFNLNLLNHYSGDNYTCLLDIYKYWYLLTTFIAQTILLYLWLPSLNSILSHPFYCNTLYLLSLLSYFVFNMEKGKKSFKQTLITTADKAKASEEQTTYPGKKNQVASLDETITPVGNKSLGYKNKSNFEKGESSRTKTKPNASAFLVKLSKFKNNFSKNQESTLLGFVVGKHIDFNKKISKESFNINYFIIKCMINQAILALCMVNLAVKKLLMLRLCKNNFYKQNKISRINSEISNNLGIKSNYPNWNKKQSVLHFVKLTSWCFDLHECMTKTTYAHFDSYMANLSWKIENIQIYLLGVLVSSPVNDNSRKASIKKKPITCWENAKIFSVGGGIRLKEQTKINGYRNSCRFCMVSCQTCKHKGDTLIICSLARILGSCETHENQNCNFNISLSLKNDCDPLVNSKNLLNYKQYVNALHKLSRIHASLSSQIWLLGRPWDFFSCSYSTTGFEWSGRDAVWTQTEITNPSSRAIIKLTLNSLIRRDPRTIKNKANLNCANERSDNHNHKNNCESRSIYSNSHRRNKGNLIFYSWYDSQSRDMTIYQTKVHNCDSLVMRVGHSCGKASVNKSQAYRTQNHVSKKCLQKSIRCHHEDKPLELSWSR